MALESSVCLAGTACLNIQRRGTPHSPKDMQLQFVFDLQRWAFGYQGRHGEEGVEYLWVQFLSMKFGSGFRDSMYN